MADIIRDLCPNCMSELDPETGICPQCKAAVAESRKFEDALPVHTVLIGRYQVGNAYDRNGESIRYIGYDLVAKRRVWIREYMPSNIAVRTQDGATLAPMEGRQAQYKALMYDFIDLNKGLRVFSSQPGIVPLFDTLHANNTAYAVFELAPAMTYDEFLQRCGGTLNWDQARPLFMPLLATVANLHKKGIVHRGISPKTVWIDHTGTLQLMDFAIPSLRTAQSELTPQLFPGFSAPEQYSPSGWQGTWTDVYALGAMLYQTLTGLCLPEADERSLGDPVMEVSQCNSLVPQGVSIAVMEAIAVNAAARTQTADELSCRLMNDSSSNTAVYHREAGASQEIPTLDDTMLFENTHVMEAQPAQRLEDKPGEGEKGKQGGKEPPGKKNSKYILMAGIFSSVLLLVIIIIFLVTYAGRVNSNSSSSELSQSTSSQEDLVPNFVGRYAQDIQNDAAYQSSYTFSIKQDYNDEYPEGVVYDQNPKAQTQPSGMKTAVTLYVSKGSQSSSDSSSSEAPLELPNFVGRVAADVEKNSSYKEHFLFSLKYDYNEDYREGVVYDQSPKENTPISGKVTVTLYVSKGSRYVALPTNLVGITVQAAQTQLSNLGIESAIAYVEDDTVAEGIVVGTDRGNGEKIDKTSQTVTLYVSKKSENTTSSSSGDSSSVSSSSGNSEKTSSRQ